MIASTTTLCLYRVTLLYQNFFPIRRLLRQNLYSSLAALILTLPYYLQYLGPIRMT
jgi:hypothetical protein